MAKNVLYKAGDVRAKTADQLSDLLLDLRKEQFNLRFQRATGQLENTSRVTDARVADLNGDGKLDIALAQFGYDEGEVSWLERTGPWEFKRHVLLELSGAINVCIADFNGDHKPDIVALISQQWEEIYYFENNGRGEFTPKRIWGSTNEDYGSSGISVCDLNRDGRPAII